MTSGYWSHLSAEKVNKPAAIGTSRYGADQTSQILSPVRLPVPPRGLRAKLRRGRGWSSRGQA